MPRRTERQHEPANWSASGREELERVLTSTVNAFSTAVEQRDPFCVGQRQRVVDLAGQIAAELCLPAKFRQDLRIASSLYDTGKMFVPAEIFAKPHALTETEFSIMSTHCQRGYEILAGSAMPDAVALAALQHHERLDGSGYPFGLKGDAIGMEARIIAIADVLEAMLYDRPYRKSLGIEAALGEITDNLGNLYDTTAGEACIRLLSAAKHPNSN
jgi:HD-GYP domain-containing protein (c-di-GMP phosphodiesterase class II)